MQKIKDLEALERLTGIVDDRGKYIYIRKKELEVVET
jgi:hypothetical protein